MGELLPTRQAAMLQAALLDYLTTTFALADSDARTALTSFLEHQADGIFKGPYVRTRLPFAPAPDGAAQALDVMPEGFVPYGHQAAAFARLSSRDHRPQPTLVTTGTGSGKTECFLLPILDHAARARRLGKQGMKALILYPMNALANDQALRIARLISGAPAGGGVNPYAGITAALYTGEDGPKRTKVSEAGLITSREVIRSAAPDILLTNYKMLDHLLLRADDSLLWEQSADSLQYVVLDEFHTYDGAQGTDVAMLLRRLGMTLKSYWPVRGSEADAHTDADWTRALGRATPVGTSATLGDGRENSSMVTFASEIFGEAFDSSCVITESRLGLEEWVGDATRPPGFEPATLTSALLDELVDQLEDVSDGESLCRGVLAGLYARATTDRPGPTTSTPIESATSAELLLNAKALPLVQDLIENTARATSLDDLVDLVLPAGVRGSHPDTAAAFLSLVIAAMSHLRFAVGRTAPSIETHLWVRELTRIDRVASSAASYRWGDDGSLVAAQTDESTATNQGAFPAIYCRHCGRSGWGVELAMTGLDLAPSHQDIRRNHLAQTGRFRALIHAPSEAQRAVEGEPVDGLAWLNTQSRDLSGNLPDPDDADYRHGRILPVLLVGGKDADDLSRTDTCPSCQQRDGIRFLGSAIATLLSVSLSTLFGTPDLNPDEKKALVFTDSVQDAAHRAGFVAARSHTLTMRSVMRDAFAGTTGELTLPELAAAILARAGTDRFRRYRILPSEFTADEKMRPFWEAEHPALVTRDVRDKVERRLLFDLAMEFGMASRLGRTLEATGSLGLHVNVGSPARMATLARAAIKNDDQATLDERERTLTDRVLVQWVRGVVEHMRTQGSIDHVWFERYLKQDGNRWMIWGGRPASQGMPAFPKNRTAPAFPRVGGKSQNDPLLDSVTDPRSWYARWTGRALGLSPQHGARLVRGLLDRLARDLVLSAVTTDSGGVAYGIPQAHVLVTPTTDADLAAKRHQLLCDTCHSHVTGSVDAVAQLAGAPCLYARCPGRLSPSAMQPANFYRRLYASSDMRRIVSREHTSLLDAKVRLEYEDGFKRGQSDPASPNTLVATPTLELGIDIGDLSAVFLASLPRTVASYLQRIGRAGRLTGNALNLAYVTGRGESLPRLGDPSSLINGAVRPPSIYLSAEEILQRQYLAYLMDAFARDGVDSHHPRTARLALENTTPGSFLGDLIAYAEAGAGELLARFLESFGKHLRPEAIGSLRAWAMPGDEPRTSGLAAQVYGASTAWRAAKELLEHRQTAIAQSIPGLQQAAAVPAATEDDKRALQTAQAALKQVQARLGDIAGEYWIATLEEFGLLPNYTLLGDSATLDVSMSWYDPEQGTYESRPESISRATAQALREFAPGATFYAKGLQIEVDAIDLGTDADGIRTYAFCDACGYAVDVAETGATKVVSVCPRCGSDGIADMGQRVDVVELKRASAAIRRDEAMIDDRADERLRTAFTLVTAVDIDPAQVKNAWYVEGYDFGAKYVNRLTIRWLNVGKRLGTAAQLAVAGEVYSAPRFRVCEGCGHLDNSARSNSMDEHRPWCQHRKSSDEHVRTIALSRTLVTQGVVLPLPWTVTTGDLFALPSLQAALLLGLRDQFGGSPDHIGVTEVRDPGVGGATTPALLLHDTVPGGTGYLADLANPADLWSLLVRAYETVRDCPCQDEGRLACHRCLLPLAPPYLTDRVSRLSAERHLRALLTAGSDGEVVTAGGWQTTAVATQDPGHESHLELRFREAFRRMVEGLGATIKEEPGPWGNTILFTLGSLQWRLEPQVLLDGVRPDFLLTSGKPGPRVAIFTDGFAFHATPAHNRIAEDAAKREVLRLKGDVVLSVTSRDLDLYEAGSGRDAPAWFRTDFLPLLTGMYGFSAHVATSALAGPMGMLAEWIQQLQRADFEKFARAVPLGLPHTVDLVVAERASLTEIARGLFEHPDSATAGADQNAWWWRQGALGVLARRQRIAAGGPMLVDVAVVLDSRTSALVEPGFRTDWETWLELSNLLMFRTGELVTTIGALATDEPPRVDVIYPMPRRIDLPERWKQVIRDVMNSEAEELAQELSLMGVPAPDWVGEEIGGELIPVDFAWTTAQIAVLLGPDERDVRDLEVEGWRVVRPDADAIAAMLEGARP